MLLDGKLALVTGAGSGIGRALAALLVDKGAHAILVGRRESRLRATARQLKGAGCTTILAADITTEFDVERLRSTIQDRFGRLDLLINNAGLIEVGPIADLERSALERLIATNLVAPILLTRALIPCLAAASPARVLNVGSMFGDIAHPLFAAYSADGPTRCAASSPRSVSRSPMPRPAPRGPPPPTALPISSRPLA
jgi:short-subunit dehydrogenase